MSLARSTAHLGRHLPAARLLVAAQMLMLAREHVTMLEPSERRRVIELVRRGHGRRGNLTDAERDELADLIAKTAPRQFVGTVAKRVSPLPLPNRLVYGRRRRTAGKR